MGPMSPSRLRADRFDGKRACFRRKRPWEAARRSLAVAAIALAMAWPVKWLLGRGDNTVFTHGPVANVHAAWDHDCAACHRTPPTPTTLSDFFAVHDRWRDFSCEKCHGQAVPVQDPVWDNVPLAVHHANLKWDLPLNRQCAECHHDHQGREHSLTRLNDSVCTRCHDGRLIHYARVAHRAKETRDASSFVADHPEFRKLDPTRSEDAHQRRMKFSHSLHMTPGQGAKRTLSKLGDYASRYRLPGQSDEDLVHLECSSCHRLDSGRGRDQNAAGLLPEGVPTESVLPSRAAGAHMVPISYEQHCQPCHPLDVHLGQGQGSYALQGLPHRLQPAPLARWLNDALTARLIERDPKAKSVSVLDGRLDEREWESLEATVAESVGRLVKHAGDELYGTGVEGDRLCVKCHETESAKPGAIPPDRIVPPSIPTVWFEKARFSHVAHRAMNCIDCHPHKGSELDEKGMPKNPEVVEEHEPIGKGQDGEWHGFVGIASCRACHRPLELGDGPDRSPAAHGGVRHGCTDCHSYHNGANPLQGLGAAARDPQIKGAIGKPPVAP